MSLSCSSPTSFSVYVEQPDQGHLGLSRTEDRGLPELFARGLEHVVELVPGVTPVAGLEVAQPKSVFQADAVVGADRVGVAGAKARKDVELALEALPLVVQHEVVVAAAHRRAGEPAGHHRPVAAPAEPVAGLRIDHQQLVVEAGAEAARPRGDVVAADGPALAQRVLDAEVGGSRHPEQGVALQGEEKLLALGVHRLVVAVGHRPDAEEEAGRDRRTDIAEVQKGDLRLSVEAGVLAYVVDGLEPAVQTVMEFTAEAEADAGLVDEVETVEPVVAARVVRDVEDVVRLETDVVDDRVPDHRLAEEVLAPVAVRHPDIAQGHLHAVDRSGPPARSEAVAQRVAGTLGMVAHLEEALDAGSRKEIGALGEGAGGVEPHGPARAVHVTVAEHVLVCRRRILLLRIATDGPSQKGCSDKEDSYGRVCLHRLCSGPILKWVSATLRRSV